MMTAERWHELNIYEQLGNVGSAFFRAAKGSTNADEFYELLDLTIADPRRRGEMGELLRLREVASDVLLGTKQYDVSAEQLNNYFLEFGLAARRGR